VSRVPTLHGLQNFFEHVLQHLLVQAQVRHELFEVLIFFFQLLEPAQFGHAQSAVFFLPIVVGGLADAHLPAYLRDGHARVGLAQRKHDLGRGKLGLFQGSVYWFKVRQVPDFLYFTAA
jgi:hypothetical protein